jgi:NADH:ubiquinone oxidoreductase subunit 6 (subunit J)
MHRRGKTFKLIGIISIASGTLVILCFMPVWAWLMLIGLLFIALGIFFLRSPGC